MLRFEYDSTEESALYATKRPMREEQFYVSWETVIKIDICQYMAFTYM